MYKFFWGVFGLLGCLFSMQAAAQSAGLAPGQAAFGALNEAFEVSPDQQAALDQFTAELERIAAETADPAALSALQTELAATLRALQAPLRKAMGEANEALQAALLSARQADLFGPGEDPALGEGELVVVEFFDYQCGYCKRMLPSVLAAIDTYKVKVRIKELPVLGEMSQLAARYALAAHRQGKYAEFHTRLVQERSRLSPDLLTELAADIDLNIDQLKRDAESPEIAQVLADNLSLARDLGIRGTPAFFIGDTPVYGALPEEDFLRLVSEAKAALSG